MIMRLLAAPFWVRTIAVAAILSAALAMMVWDRVQILQNGTEIVLETRPIDPRSLFRGHYVRLNYDISNIKPETVKTDGKFKRGERVFVRLKPGMDGYWKAVAISQKPVPPQKNTAMIAGKIGHHSAKSINIRYGIERYFVPKTKALKLENINRDKVSLAVILRLSGTGTAAISGLMIDGKKIYDEPLF